MTLTLPERFAREYQAYNQISAERAKQQLRLLAEFEAHMGKPLDQVTMEDFKAFAGYLKMDRNYHVNTVRKKLNQIRPFFSWAYAAGVITADTYMKLRTVKDPRGATGQSEPNPYDPAEVQRLFAELESKYPLLPKQGKGSQQMKRWIQGKSPFRGVWRHAMRLQLTAVVRLALDGGLRRSEIFRLSINDAHYDNEYIVVSGVAKGENFSREMTRHVPMTGALRKALHDWVEMRALMRPDHDSLWLTCFGPAWYSNPMSESNFNSLLADKIGPGWELHRLRHTAATEWLRAGAPLEIVSTMLGHSSLQQTRAYTKIVGRDIERELRKVEPIFMKRLERAITNKPEEATG